MIKKSLLITVTSLAFATGAFAEEANTANKDARMDTIEVSGLRPIAREDLTSAATVLQVDELAIRNAGYVADQLRAIPSVGVSRSGSKGGLTQIRIRGAEANHTLVLINGIEVSDPTTGETNFGLISGLDVDSIEVLRGEQSGLYGSDAIGGVVNVITGTPQGLNGQLEYGSLDTANLQAGYGQALSNGYVGFDLSGFTTDGVDTSGNDGEEDGTEQWAAMANGSVEIAKGWELSGLARYSHTDVQYDSDTDYDGLLNDIDLSSESDQWLIGAALNGDAYGLNHSIRASFTSITRDNFSAGSLTDTAEGQRTKLAYSPSVELASEFTESVRLSGIVDYEKEDYDVSDTQYGGLTDQSQSFETLGLAGEVNIDWGDLITFASLRFDDNDGRFKNATTGRLGAAYDTNAYGRFRASVGTGVKNPNFTELFGFYPGSFIGNPDLKPETSTGWELGWANNIGPFSLDLTYFEAELEDEIYTSNTPTFPSTPLNRIGKSERSGVEASANWSITETLTAHGQFSVIDSSADDGSEEIRVPEQTGSVSFDYQPANLNGYRFGLAFDYVGEQDDYDFGSWPSRRVTMDSYVLASASAEIPVSEKLAITLRGENLFDENVSDVYGYHAPGATLYIGVKIR